MVFWNSAGFSLVFANVNARSPLTGIIRVFGHGGRDLLRNHTQPATYCALRTVKGREKSRMCTTYQTTSMRFWFFRACAFLAKKKVMGFSGSVNGTGFLDFGFCQFKWAYRRNCNVKGFNHPLLFWAQLKVTTIRSVTSIMASKHSSDIRVSGCL